MALNGIVTETGCEAETYRVGCRHGSALLPPPSANRWRPGQSGNPSGHSGEYGEAMRLARQAAPRAILRLMELAALDRIYEQVNLIPLQQLPEADPRVVAVAANPLLDRAFGRPKQLLDDSKQDDPPVNEQRIGWHFTSLARARRYRSVCRGSQGTAARD
jgi:hypothetical protein